METAILTSSIMWPIMLLLWIGLFINTKYYRNLAIGFDSNKGLIIITSMVWMVAWSYMVANHNVSLWLPSVIISLVWWAILLKSSLLLSLPTSFTKILGDIKYTINLLKGIWLIFIIIGLYLMNYAYFWV